MEEKTEKRFNSLEARLDSLEARLDSLESKLDSLISSFLSHSQHSIKSFKATDQNFEIINTKVDNLINHSSTEFKGVGEKLGEIKHELVKIQKVSNYSQEYENLLHIAK
jgi:chromosome segregation ATPase